MGSFHPGSMGITVSILILTIPNPCRLTIKAILHGKASQHRRQTIGQHNRSLGRIILIVLPLHTNLALLTSPSSTILLRPPIRTVARCWLRSSFLSLVSTASAGAWRGNKPWVLYYFSPVSSTGFSL